MTWLPRERLKTEYEMICLAQVESIRDFATGVGYCVPLVSLAMLAARRGKAPVHYAGMAFFGHLAIMETLLFFVHYIAEAEGCRVDAAEDLYQLTVVPFGVVVLHELTHPRGRWVRILALNALPFYAAIGVYAATGSEAFYRVWMAIAVAYGALSIAYTHREIKRYDRLLHESLSCTEDVDLRWLRRIAWCCLGVLAVWVTAWAIDMVIAYTVYSVVVAAIFFALAFCLYRQEVAEIGDDDGCGEGGACGEDEIEEDSAYGFAREFKRLFNEERIYLDKDLNIDQLCRLLGTNRTYMSRYLNTELGTTFYDYVNRRRVEHSMVLLSETGHKIESVAKMSGFNSVMTYRRAFQTYAGLTPGEYRLKSRGEGRLGKGD